ncbi:uncharacterized protein TOL2_C25920 [Desulfobacula toluolica Tol2]|uniref:Uncharacterized protein n=1 Tax=Desulfobacula toluolica (strain DSM 7467 / Tol2) TaxID=651182 RepID=K0NHI6_DESTT|nr:uncharacterized protein TOL2_C25920 [Desulfobacula toluolica Tol2]
MCRARHTTNHSTGFRKQRETSEFNVPGGCAAWNAVLTSSSPWPRRLAPEPGAGPVTARRSIKLRLLDRRTVPVSTALIF